MKTTFHQITGNVHEKKAAMEANFRLLHEGEASEKAVLKYADELLKMPRRSLQKKVGRVLNLLKRSESLPKT